MGANMLAKEQDAKQVPQTEAKKRRWISESTGLVIFEPFEDEIDPITGRTIGLRRLLEPSKGLVKEIDIRKLSFHGGFVAWPYGMDWVLKEVGIFETSDPFEIALLEKETKRVARTADRYACFEYSREEEENIKRRGMRVREQVPAGATIQE